MILVCTHVFGNFVPGDEVEVPDGAVFDGAYFAEQTQLPVTAEPAAITETAQESER